MTQLDKQTASTANEIAAESLRAMLGSTTPRRTKGFTDSPELLTNFCLRELARRWGPAKVGRPASRPLRVDATSDPSSPFESFTDSLAPRVPGPSTFSAKCHQACK
ncbi:hypothetical protein HN011_001904 [Eciton burchellii]|nr:hypothetical protein HN011_001904 [Eciton burchellii]